MASTNTLLTLRPQDAFPESGGNIAGAPDLIPVGLARGAGFPKLTDSAVVFVNRLPATAALATGATAVLMLADDVKNADPGKVAVFAVTYKLLASGTDVVDWTGAGTETTVSVTMPSTAGVVVTGTIALAVPNMDSLAASSWCAVRVRRLGTNSSDTHRGRVVLLSVDVRDT